MSVTENTTERMVRYRLIAFCHAVCCRRESLRPGTFLSQSSGSPSSTAGPGRWSCRLASGYGPPPSPPRRLGLGIRRGSWAGCQDGVAVGAFLLDKRQLHRRQPVQEEPGPAPGCAPHGGRRQRVVLQRHRRDGGRPGVRPHHVLRRPQRDAVPGVPRCARAAGT